MKISIKILILVLCVVIAVGAILFFIKTQLAPPGDIRFDDPYAPSLNSDIAQVSAVAYPKSKDNFVKAYHKIKFMRGEDLLTDEQADELITQVDTAYGRKIVDYAYRIFNTSSWPESELTVVTTNIADLRNDRLSNGDRAITHRMDNSFQEVEGVIEDYRDSWAFARNTGFRSLEDARIRIGKIDDYLNRPYMSNNTALVAALRNLPSAINNSHYNYLVAKVNSLNGYRNMSVDQFNRLVQSVEEALKAYENSTIYGSLKKNLSPLRQREENIIDAANNYFYPGDYYYY